MKANKGIEFEQLTSGFERGIGALDELRLMLLGDGFRLQGAQNRVKAREYERLKRKYGKDHPRTLNATAKIEIGKEHMQVISIVHTTASAPRPDPGNGWAVDGFVRLANGDPINGVTVAAYDRQERWYEEFGYGCTDDRGYFSIVVEKLAEKPPNLVFMRASKGKKLLASNEVQLAPERKSSDRVEIIISDTAGTGDCMPPAGGKGEPRPPDQTPGGKHQPARPAKGAKEQSEDPAKPAEATTDKPEPALKLPRKEKATVTAKASGPMGEKRVEAAKGTRGKLKEADTKDPIGGPEKGSPTEGGDDPQH